MTKRARIRALTLDQRAVLVEALAQLPLTALAMRLVGPKRLGAMMGAGPRAFRAGSFEAACEIARIVDMAARHGVLRPNCLQRSVALWRILHRHGIDSELRLGVRRDSGAAAPEFHAWVEHDGAVLNDRPDVRGHYLVLERAVDLPADGVAFG